MIHKLNLEYIMFSKFGAPFMILGYVYSIAVLGAFALISGPTVVGLQNEYIYFVLSCLAINAIIFVVLVCKIINLLKFVED
ncbi:hypothetical protein GD1_110 [Paraglaciecola Antarctic GD virus 1]|nr:hypothetical protein GD1_110 [Paraglaciecola Antarctic GD virus 1]